MHKNNANTENKPKLFFYVLFCFVFNNKQKCTETLCFTFYSKSSRNQSSYKKNKVNLTRITLYITDGME